MVAAGVNLAGVLRGDFKGNKPAQPFRMDWSIIFTATAAPCLARSLNCFWMVRSLSFLRLSRRYSNHSAQAVRNSWVFSVGKLSRASARLLGLVNWVCLVMYRWAVRFRTVWRCASVPAGGALAF